MHEVRKLIISDLPLITVFSPSFTQSSDVFWLYATKNQNRHHWTTRKSKIFAVRSLTQALHTGKDSLLEELKTFPLRLEW